jgi:hypothetical protein
MAGSAESYALATLGEGENQKRKERGEGFTECRMPHRLSRVMGHHCGSRGGRRDPETSVARSTTGHGLLEESALRRRNSSKLSTPGSLSPPFSCTH